MATPLNLPLLKKILSQPTAPFREKHVIETITDLFRKKNIPHFQDPIGNIVVGATSKKEYLKLIRTPSKKPLPFFIAHMDHPGFHGVKWLGPNQLAIKWLGGSPTQALLGSKVWIANKEGYVGHGILTKATLFSTTLNVSKSIDKGVVKVTFLGQANSTQIPARSLFGGFGFRSPVWQEGQLLYTKSADDLVGSFAITTLALKHLSRKNRTPFLGLLTRAEEIGFIGAIGHFELGWLSKAKRKILCVSLETSRTLPGAVIGKGPVIRLGDRYTVFDATSLRAFLDLAKKNLRDGFQKRVMDGGTCEGTVAMAYGFRTVGISVPLGNYHNQNLEGGPDSSRKRFGPAPEFVHLADVKGLLSLCEALATSKTGSETAWRKTIDEFKKNLKKYTPLLKSGPLSSSQTGEAQHPHKRKCPHTNPLTRQ